MDRLWDSVRDKLSVAKDGAEKLAKVALDKTSTAVDVTKLTFAKKDTEMKINKLYQKIGETIYQSYLKDNDQYRELSDVLADIDRFKEEIKELEAQIAALKNDASEKDCTAPSEADDTECSSSDEDIVVDIIDD